MTNILVIDNNESVTKLLKKLLKEEGYKVDAETSGRPALKNIKKNGYEVVLLEIKLPDISGLTIIEHIKKIDPKIIVIMITGHSSINIAIEALNKGADGFISKPIKLEELIFTIENKLKQLKKI